MHRGEPNAEAAQVLRSALGLLKHHGWQPHWLSETERFRAIRAGNKRAKALSVVDAIQIAGNASVASYHARQVVQRLVGPVPAWEQHPLRVWADIEHTLRRAIDLAGEKPPGRGNWRVTCGPWKPEGGGR